MGRPAGQHADDRAGERGFAFMLVIWGLGLISRLALPQQYINACTSIVCIK